MNVGELFARLRLNIDDFRRNLNDAQGQLQSVGDRMKGIGQAMSLAITAPVIGGFVAITEGTRELRQDLGKLDAAFTTNGFTAEQAKDVYREFYGILGESDTAIEASNHLALLVDNQKELNDWVTIATGVYATFGDSLPIEGLTEAANETAKVGQVTGPLADALNWAGVSEDAFNESLAACTTEQERQSLITETLNGLYTEAAEKYREVNGEVIEANKANAGLKDGIAELGQTLEPVLTTIVEGATKLINKFNSLDPATKNVIFVLTAITAVIGPLLVVVGTMIASFTSVVGVLAKIPAAITVVKTALLGINPVFAAIGVAILAGIYVWQKWGDEIKAIVSNAVEFVKAKFNDMVNAGKNIVQGLWDGIKSMGATLKSNVTNFIDEHIPGVIKRLLKISSPSKVTEEFGQMVADGLIKGMRDKIPEVEEQTNRLAQAIKTTASSMLSELSGAMDLINAKFGLQKDKLGENATEVEKLRVEQQRLRQEKNNLIERMQVLKTAYEMAKKELGENNEATKQYRNELNLAWIELQRLDIEINNTNKSIDEQKKKLKDAANEQANALRDLAQEITTVEQKYRNDLAAALDEYQRKVAEVNNKLIADERALTEQYEDEVKRRTQTLSNFAGLFGSVSNKEVSGEQLLENLRGQVSTLGNWEEDLAELASRGIDDGLLDELREMGPKAAPEIAALNTLTDEQLAEYTNLWRERTKKARNEAVKQLEGQRRDMLVKMQEIRQEAAEQLESYRAEWERKNNEIRKNAEKEMDAIEKRFKDISKAGTKYGISLVENFIGGLESRFDNLRETLTEMAMIVDSYMPHSPAKVGPLSKIMDWGPSLVDTFAKGIETNLPKIKNAMYDIAFVAQPSAVNNQSMHSNTVINVGGISGTNADEIWEKFKRELQRYGVRWT